jgi:hypothetical protein
MIVLLGAKIAGYCSAPLLTSTVRVRDYRAMKWSTAVGHLRRLAAQCAEMAELPASYQAVPVSALWAVGDVLGTPRDLDWVKVALIVDLPVSEVPWFCTRTVRGSGRRRPGSQRTRWACGGGDVGVARGVAATRCSIPAFFASRWTIRDAA